jgi:hypothetical protein
MCNAAEFENRLIQKISMTSYVVIESMSQTSLSQSARSRRFEGQTATDATDATTISTISTTISKKKPYYTRRVKSDIIVPEIDLDLSHVTTL